MSCGNSYIAGGLVVLTVSVTSKDTGQPINATTIAAKVKTPSGVIVDLSSQVQNPEVGTYTANYQPTELGQFQYEFIGTGAAVFVTLNTFTVNEEPF